MDALDLARMLQFGDSMLPTGAFAFSSGLEAAAQKKVVHDAETLRQFAETALEQAASGDAVGVAWAVRAARLARGGENSEALDLLRMVDNALFVRKLPEESRSMFTRTGKKLAEMGAAVTAAPLATRWLELIHADSVPGTYPVTLAVLFAAMREGSAPAVPTEPAPAVPPDDPLVQEALTVHLYGVVMGILNAALRLMRLTHIEAQSVLYGLTARFDELAGRAATTPLECMSNYAPMTDILGAAHARAHVRLFMS